MKSFLVAACTATFVAAQDFYPNTLDAADSAPQLFASGFIEDFMGVDNDTAASYAASCYDNGDMIKNTMEATTYIRLEDYVRGYHKLFKYWSQAPET